MKKEKISLDKLEEMLRRFRNLFNSERLDRRLDICPFCEETKETPEAKESVIHHCEYCNYLFPEGEGLFSPLNHPCQSLHYVQEVIHALFPDPKYTYDSIHGLMRTVWLRKEGRSRLRKEGRREDG